MTIYDIDVILQSYSWKDKDSEVEAFVTDVIKQTFNCLERPISHMEISVVLADNAFLQELNFEYRGKDAPTNVLSFPATNIEDLDEPAAFLCLGDIVIAHETIKKEAVEQNKSFKDHFTHMLVHGCLHLLHYDHIDEKDAQEMESLEINILENMNIKNPYENW